LGSWFGEEDDDSDDPCDNPFKKMKLGKTKERHIELSNVENIDKQTLAVI
jgi:hypothetical protein